MHNQPTSPGTQNGGEPWLFIEGWN